MKKILLALPLLLFAAGFSLNNYIDGKIQDLLRQIQLDEASAKNQLFSDFSGSSLYLPNIRSLKSIALGERASIVKVVGDFAKQYTVSKEFINKYNEYREIQKPNPPEKPKTVAEMKQEYKDNLKKSIEESENNLSQMPEESKKYIIESIKQLREQLKQIDDPNNAMFSPDMDKIMQDSYKQQLEQHKLDLQNWEKEYPEGNPNKMIKAWLNNFLEVSKDVDFNAKTAIDTNGRAEFVKQEYQRKDSNWKLCFRAGKETVETARKFAQNWLKELK